MARSLCSLVEANRAALLVNSFVNGMPHSLPSTLASANMNFCPTSSSIDYLRNVARVCMSHGQTLLFLHSIL